MRCMVCYGFPISDRLELPVILLTSVLELLILTVLLVFLILLVAVV